MTASLAPQNARCNNSAAGEANISAVPIDDALRSVMILAWDEFAAVRSVRAVRVEYLCEPGICLYDLTIWVVTEGGYQERFCDYRVGQVAGRPKQWRCWARAHCTELFSALDFVMRTQERFLFAPDASRQGLIIVSPPTEQERVEARLWMQEVGGAEPAPPARARAAQVS